MNGRMTPPANPDPTGSAAPPQWSRPMNGRMTARPGLGVGRPRAAAMEPADERPDDRRSPTPWCSTGPVPQWSRPMNGRMTLQGNRDRHFDRDGAAMEPADERPDDSPRSTAADWAVAPQWSRPMNGRMTARENRAV